MRLDVQSESNGAIVVCVVCVCCLSILGCFMIIYSYLRWPEMRTISRKLLVFLSIADMITAAGNMAGMLGPTELSPFCKTQSAVTTFSSMASFHWTVYIAWYLYLCMPGVSENPNRIIYLFHCAAWGIPMAIVGLALGFDALGGPSFKGELWCWIDESLDENEKIIWGMVTGKGWEILCYLATIVLYYNIRQRMKRSIRISSATTRTRRNQKNVPISKADFKLALIPIIFVAIRIWGTLGYMLHLAGLQYGDWLVLLVGMGDSSQGLANGILFCVFTEKVRRKYISCIQCKQDEDTEREPIINEDEADADAAGTEQFLQSRPISSHSLIS